MHAKGTFSRRCGLISDREDMLVRRLPANQARFSVIPRVQRCGLISDREDMLVRRLPANQARFSVIPRVQHTIDTQEKGFSLRLS